MMKSRGVRVPTTSYDALRQQVQAKRGSPTNRMEAEGPSSPSAAATVAPEERPAETTSAPIANDNPSEAGPEAAPPLVKASPPQARSAPQASRPAPGRAARDITPAGQAGGARVTLKLNFTAPAVGAYPHYDRVIETMSPRVAVPLLLAKALDELEAAVLRGEAVRLIDYHSERNGERISTSRTMDATTLERLRGDVDPHHLMKPSSLGAALATTALALYLRKHS